MNTTAAIEVSPVEVDPIKEMRMRTWARRNYAPAQERDDAWHPVILDEMTRIDGEQYS